MPETADKTHREKGRVLIVEARFYDDIADLLLEGAVGVLDASHLSYDCRTVPGALEVPAAINLASKTDAKDFDGFLALGCVIRGETAHYDIVAGESARGLMDLTTHKDLLIANGILTCETRKQALRRADPDKKNKGAAAALALISLLNLKKNINLDKA